MLKNIERGTRRISLELLRRFGRRPAGSPDVIGSVSRPGAKILLLRHDRIGDAAISTPVVAKLRDRFPDARIDMLFGEKNASVAGLIPGLATRWVLPRSPIALVSVLRSIRAVRYDAVLNLLTKSSASAAVVTALSGGRFRIGLDAGNASLYDICIPPAGSEHHIVVATSRILSPFGIATVADPPRHRSDLLGLEITPERRAWGRARISEVHHEEQGPLVVVNISTRGVDRYLGTEKYVELISGLQRIGVHPCVAAVAADRTRQESICAAGGGTMLPPTSRLEEYCALLENADFVITPDTAVVHLSAALGRPVVMLATSAQNSREWHPWGVPYEVVHGTGGIPTIDVDDVLSAFIRLTSATILPPSSSSTQ